MAVALFKFFVKIITTFANLLFYPFIIAFQSLLPSYSDMLSSMLTLLTQGLWYCSIIRDLLCIPVSALTILLDYYLIKYSIFAIRTTIHFTATVYEKFKA